MQGGATYLGFKVWKISYIIRNKIHLGRQTTWWILYCKSKDTQEKRYHTRLTIWSTMTSTHTFPGTYQYICQTIG